MKFSDRIRLRVEGQKELPLIREWIAEEPSWQSATNGWTKYWNPSYAGALQAMAVIFLCTFLPPWENDKIIHRISISAYQHRYQGRWEDVQEILELDYQLWTDEKIWFSYFSEDDFFGNFLIEAEKILRRYSLAWKDFDDRKKPRRNIRRRGYQDKGSLRPPDQRGRILPDPSPGDDRRDLVRHPLICISKECGGDTHPPSERKEMKFTNGRNVQNISQSEG